MMTLRTRERILTIRLLEKIKEYPAYAKKLGVTVKKFPNKPKS